MATTGTRQPSKPSVRAQRRNRHLIARKFKPANQGKPNNLQPGGTR